MRSKKKYLQRMGDIIAGNKKFRWKKKITQYEIWEKWENIIGSAIAENARPASWRKHTLIVHTSNHAWANELQYMREEILEKIRSALPHTKIDGVRFELGRPDEFMDHPSDKDEKRIPSFPPPSERDVEVAHNLTKSIKDEEIRNTIRRLIEKDLSRKKHL